LGLIIPHHPVYHCAFSLGSRHTPVFFDDGLLAYVTRHAAARIKKVGFLGFLTLYGLNLKFLPSRMSFAASAPEVQQWI
jgi:hypothetical protein